MKKVIFSIFLMFLLAVDPLFLEGSSFKGYGFLQGKASWYSRKDRGIRKRTANMEIFKDTGLTCAAWGLPFGSLLEVTNLDNGKSVIVRVNDRGPAKRLVRRGRIIDLTKTAFSAIADNKNGLIDVRVEIKSL